MQTELQSEATRVVTGAVVVGAGFAGLCMTRRLVERGVDVCGVEAGADLGGTWYWNKYPGARTDSEGSIYRFGTSPELDREWMYTEKFPAQHEVLGYLGAFAEKYDLAKHYRFSTRVTRAEFDLDTKRWTIDTDSGVSFDARYFISGAGLLSDPVTPDIAGVADYRGQVVHTSRWPEDLDLRGKRVAVFGTGSTGIQLVPAIAETVADLHVFQRTPNYIVPSSNTKLTTEAQVDLVDRLPEIRRRARASAMSMPYTPSGRSALEVSADEREAVYRKGWQNGGFRFYIETFDDLMVDYEANVTAQDFLRARIAEVVEDPATAAALMPDYPYGVKRPPTGIEYFEAFNRDNVHLVDTRKLTEPLRFTNEGIVVDGDLHEFDVVIFATGFDVATGSILKMNVVGTEGLRLEDHWSKGASTYMALAVHGFPNFFMIMGPHSPSGNQPTVVEYQTELIANVISHATAHGLDAVEATAEAEWEWTNGLAELAEATLVNMGRNVNSWVTGSNIEGKPESVLIYLGPTNEYFDSLEALPDTGYPGLSFG